MTKTALISDIHANLEALEAVMAHIDAQGDIDKILCLGDVVGYGPDPAAVIDIVKERCEWCLMGNHDFAILHAPVGFNQIAAGAIQCQRLELMPDGEESEPGVMTMPEKQFRWDFLAGLKEQMEIGDDLFVHASPRHPIVEYILIRDISQDPEKLADIFTYVKRHCFVGHTHQPGIFTTDPDFFTPEDLGDEYEFKPDEKLIINVSSVGQPRDVDPRACYATLTEESIKWHRVEYDIETTVRKVKENTCLDDRCGLRLLQGR